MNRLIVQGIADAKAEVRSKEEFEAKGLFFSFFNISDGQLLCCVTKIKCMQLGKFDQWPARAVDLADVLPGSL